MTRVEGSACNAGHQAACHDTLFGAFRHALIHALVVGLFVAVGLTLLSLCFPVFKRVEQIGIDLAERMKVSLHGLSPLSTEAPRLIFMDATSASCDQLTVGGADGASAQRCPPPTRYPTEFLTHILTPFVNLPQGERPAAVIFDLLLPSGTLTGTADADKTQAVQDLRDVMSKMPFPIIVDAEAVPERGSSLYEVPPWRDDLLAHGAAIPVVRANFHMLSDGRLADQIIRHAPIASPAYVSGLGRSEKSLFPSAALVAALYLDAVKAESREDAVTAAHAAIRDLFPVSTAAPLGENCEVGGSMAKQILPTPRLLLSDRLRLAAPAICGILADESEPQKTEIRFRFPSLAPHPELPSDGPRSLLTTYGDLVRYIDMAELVGGGILNLPRRSLSNAVVVIGNSELAANDWHRTPIGTMTGSEVLLNAVNHFAASDSMAFAGAHELGFFEEVSKKVAKKAIYVVPAALVFALLAGACAPVLAGLRKRIHYSPALKLAVGVSRLGSFFLALAISLVLALFANTYFTYLSGIRVDVVIPMIAIFVEGATTVVGEAIDDFTEKDSVHS